jgi:hypothetical protein
MLLFGLIACGGDAGFTQHQQDTVVPDDTAGDPGAMELDPTELTWDRDSVGGTIVRQFSIDSVGEGPLEVTGITLTEGATSGFGVSTGAFTFPFHIKPGQSVSVSVTLTRDVHSAVTGKVEVAGSDVNVPVATVSLVAE